MMPRPVVEVAETLWRDGKAAAGARSVPEESAVALTFGGSTHAVMMATPADLEDFGIGFCLTEGIVASAAEIEAVELIESALGIEVRMRLAGEREAELAGRRRRLAGPVGCGLCGIESLEAAMRPASAVGAGRAVAAAAILAAMHRLAPLQALNQATRAVHAAAFLDLETDALSVREDVGRHNALDKLAGALARAGTDASGGVVLLTSRVSVEMVQKSAAIGASIVVAVSAPTALAVRTAEAAGITLVGIARADGFEVFTHPHRIRFEEIGTRHVA